MILIGSEKFQIDFSFAIGEKPTFDTKKLTSGPDTIEILNRPSVENFTAHVSFKICKNKGNSDYFNVF